MTNTTAALRSKVKDVTGALRSRRYRRRQNSNESKAGVTVTTPEMCRLASRLEGDTVTAAELQLAGGLIMALVLVDRLPADSVIDVG